MTKTSNKGDYWEDRLTPEQHKKVITALRKFRKNRQGNALYDTLVNNGVYGEEAEEIISLERGDW